MSCNTSHQTHDKSILENYRTNFVVLPIILLFDVCKIVDVRLKIDNNTPVLMQNVLKLRNPHNFLRVTFTMLRVNKYKIM